MIKKSNRIIAILLIAAMLLPNFSALPVNAAEPTGDHPGNLVEQGQFDLRAYNTPGHSSGNLHVEWDDQGPDWLYRYYQRLSGETQWQERSTKYGKPIEVLNIMANGTPYLERWLNVFQEEATAKGANIHITSVTQANFNTNPESYLMENGAYKYDVVVIGFADLNGDAAQTRNRLNAVAALESYIKAGRGVLFGHDTFFDAEPLDATTLTTIATGDGNNRWQYRSSAPTTNAADNEWFNDHGGNENVWLPAKWGYTKLAKYVGVIPGVNADGTMWTSRFGGRAYKNAAGNFINGYTTGPMEYHIGDTTNTILSGTHNASFVKVTNDGFLTTYPNELPYGTVLTVPESHVNGTAASGTEWMTYVSNREGDEFPAGTSRGYAYERHNYEYDGVTYTDMGYLVSNKNTALIQTGHRNGWVTRDEIAVIVNTMYHLAQLTADTELDDSSALDNAAPDGPVAKLTGINADSTINVNLHADDNGTTYEVMVEALEQKDPFGAKNSDIVEQTSTVGTAGYLYLISSKDASEITLGDIAASNGLGGYDPEPATGGVKVGHTPNEGGSVVLNPVADASKYIHVVAYDFADNISEIKTYKVDDFKPAINVKVVDETDSPVGLANIIALGNAYAADQNGELVLYPASTGSYTIAAYADNYNMGSVTVEISSTQLVAEAKIVLKPLSSGSLYGYVKDPSDRAISGALVKTLTEGSAVTDSHGFYVINDLSEGTHTVVAGMSGYNSEFDAVAVPIGTVRKDFVLTEQSGANDRYILTGIVSDADTGTGLNGATVKLTGGGATVTTDNFGGYAMGGFENGTSYFDYAHTGYVPKLDEAVVFTNSDKEHDVALEYLDGSGRVVVRVKNSGGELISGASVVLGGQRFTTGATGEVVYTKTYGTYALLVQMAGYNAYTSQEIVNKEYTVVEVTLAAGNKGALYGRVIDLDDATGVPGATVKTINPYGGETISDSDGYYVLAPLDEGIYAVIVYKNGYSPVTENLSVIPSGATEHNFYLNQISEDIYFIFGRVYNEGDLGQGVAGATVKDTLDGATTTLTDNQGYYALVGYPAHTSATIAASKGGSTSAAEHVQIQTGNTEQNLYLRNNLTVIVQYVIEGTDTELFSYPIYTSRSAAAFDVTANEYPEYTLVTTPGTVNIDPAVLVVDENSQYILKFEYRYNMADVTIQAYLKDSTTPVTGYTPFTVKAEIGSTFTYGEAVAIPGYTFASRGAAITVSATEANIYPLYYDQNTADMTVKAVDKDSGRVIGTMQQALTLNGTYTISQANSPTTAQIPELQYYDLVLAGSYVGSVGNPSFTYTGGAGEIPDAVYIFQRKTTAVTVELQFVEDNSVIAMTAVAAPQGENFTYTLAEAQALLTAQAVNPGNYAFVTQSDQQVFIPGGGTAPKIIFYLKSSLAQITLDIHYKYYDEEGAGRLITSSQITAAEGETKTVKAAGIKGWTLAEGQETEKEVTFANNMRPVEFYYVQDLITITILAEDTSGAAITLPEGAGLVKAARDTAFTLAAPAVTGYRAMGHKMGGAEEDSTVINFSAQDMASDFTVTFIYALETMEAYTVSVQVTGRMGNEVLYSYKAVYPKDSGDHTITAFPLSGYQIIGSASAVINAGTVAVPGAVEFVYTGLDTQVIINLINDDTGEIRTFTENAVQDQPFSYNALYVEGWHLKDSDTTKIIDAVQNGDTIDFHYGTIPGSSIVVIAKEIDGQNNVLREIKTAVQSTEGWENGNVRTIDVKNLMQLEGANNYYLYAPSPADPAGAGSITFTYDALGGHTFVVHYTKEMVDVAIEAVDTASQPINSYQTSQRKGEVFTAVAPDVDLALYTPVGAMEKTAVALADSPVQFVYSRLESGTVNVVARDGNNAQNILMVYGVTGIIDQSLDIPAPILTGQGYRLAQGQPQSQTIKIQAQNDPVIFLYDDVRFELNLYTKLTDEANAVHYQREYHPSGSGVTIYAPYRDGYILSAYQIDSDGPTPITDDFTGLSLTLAGDTAVTFVYQPMEEIIEDYVVWITVTGTDAANNRTLYSYRQMAAKNSGDLQVAAFQQEGYNLTTESPKTVTVGEQDIEIEFEYASLATFVTVAMADSGDSPVAESFRINGEAGKPMTVYAPDVPGYRLTSAAEQSITPKADADENIVTFKYEKITGRVTLTAKETVDGTDRFIQVFEVPEASLTIGTVTQIDVPVIEGYTRVLDKVSVNWDGVSSLNADVYYTKNQVAATIAFVDTGGVEIAPSETCHLRLGEAANFTAPAINGYQLLNGPTATIVPQTDTENKIIFRYRTLEEDEISVRLAEKGSNRLIDSYTLSGKLGDVLKLKAPDKPGWLLDGEDTLEATVGTVKEVTFYYTADTVTVRLIFRTEDQTTLGTEETMLLRGQSFTARAAHLPGYVVAGGSEKYFAGVDQDMEATFVYRHILTEAPNYVVKIQVRGLDQSTNQELYSYTMQQPKNSGYLTLEAMNVAGYDIVGEPTTTVEVEEDDINATFYHASVKRVITIYGITTDGEVIEDFTPILAEANRGQSFTYNAPHIVGYNYVGYDTGNGYSSSTIQGIDEVLDDTALYFEYEKTMGNILITLRENGPGGRIIKTLSDSLAMGEGKNIPIPDLTADYYQTLSSQEEYVETTNNAMIQVEYYYQKEVRAVELWAVDGGNSGAVLAVKQAGSFRIGEGATFTAFYHENLEGYRLAGGSDTTAIVPPGGGSFIVTFEYQAIGNGEVLVLAVDNESNDILGNSVMKAATGSVVQANAMGITGYYLAQGEATFKDVAVPGTAVFRYTRDLVLVSLRMVDESSNAIDVSSDVQTIFDYTRGQNIKVFAPHIPGYIIKPNTSSVAAFTPITGNETVIFVYKPIEEIIGDYQITVHIIGQLWDGTELYTDTREAPRNSGETPVHGQYVWGYALNAVYVDGIAQDGATVQSGLVMVHAGTEDIEIIFQYKSLHTEVTVILEDGDTGEILDRFYEPAMAGEVFTCRAPHVNGYYLLNGSTIGYVDEVAADGSSEVVFYYRELTADVVLVAIEVGESNSIIRLAPVDVTSWEEDSYFIEVPDLKGDYFTYAGNEFDPDDGTGYIELDYYPGDSGYIEVYYTKDMADLDIMAREKTTAGKILKQQDETVRKGETTAIYAPHINDFNLISNEMHIFIPVENAEITFLYTALNTGGGGNEGGGNGGNGGGNGGGSSGGSGSSARTMTLTVLGIDKDENELYKETSRHSAGERVSVTARSLSGYILEDTAKKSITISATASKNVITFQYAKEIVEEPKEVLTVNAHKAYISGYEDGSFRPMNNITRAETAIIFFNLIEDVAKNTPQHNPYRDIAGNEWYAQAVLYLSAKGILRGDGDGTFRPASNITRGEMATLCSQFFAINTAAQHPFTDVPSSHWAAGYIANAYSKGWISGYGDGTFKPNAEILRAETVSMVNRIYDRITHKEDLPQSARTFNDVPESYWAYAAIVEAANGHRYIRRDDGHEIWQ